MLRATRLVVSVAVAMAGAGCASDATEQSMAAVTCSAPGMSGCVDPGEFLIKAYGGHLDKCVDYAPGVAGGGLFLNDCASSHAFRVERLEERVALDGCTRKYEIRLYAGDLVVTPGFLGLTLQAQGGKRAPYGRGGRFGDEIDNRSDAFVLDGDSIILAADRDQGLNSEEDVVRVIQVENSRGANRSPIVLAPRQLTDNEFFQFEAVDGTGREPTCPLRSDPQYDQLCNFHHVSGLTGLAGALVGTYGPCSSAGTAKWPPYDTVIYVETPIILLSNSPTVAAASSPPVFVITDGMTIRGDRWGTNAGTELDRDDQLPSDRFVDMFETIGNDIRFTGLRLRGPSGSTSGDDPDASAIKIKERIRESEEPHAVREIYSRIVVDHNEISQFTAQAVHVNAGDALTDKDVCEVQLPAPNLRNNRVHVVRNFIHHNAKTERGYGVQANSGAFPLVVGNTFVFNRHAIAATNSTEETGYRAYGNFVLYDAPFYFGSGGFIHTHDFDIHGTGDALIRDGRCGIGGGYTDVAWNTFFGDNRTNFEVRAVPCQGVDFQYNVSLHSRDDTENFDLGIRFGDACDGAVASPLKHQQNWFDQRNPTEGVRLGVGDFDGDGIEDLFLATGAAFYYSPGGSYDWRMLAWGRTDLIVRYRASQALPNLLFGDFDGDGRTDVAGKNGANLMVSWGGASEWEVLTQTPAGVEDLAAGNFDGTGADDILWTDGARWHIAYAQPDGTMGPFTVLPTSSSSYRVRDLRFGHFNSNDTMDCFGDVAGQWMFSDGCVANWFRVGPRLAGIDYLFIGDFDGDGRDDDVGHIDYASFAFSDNTYEYSKNGANPFSTIVETDADVAAWGRFVGGSAQTGILFWDGDEHLRIAYVGSNGDTEPHSRQDMR